MSLPIILPSGIVAVYGAGVQASNPDTAMPSGVILPSDFRYGTVYNIWDGGATYIYGGDVIYWKEDNTVVRIVTENNLTYSLVPARLATKDTPLPP